jgi:hypothetical protein
LDADAVNDALGAARGRGVRAFRRMRSLVLFRHVAILTQATLPHQPGPRHKQQDVRSLTSC